MKIQIEKLDKALATPTKEENLYSIGKRIDKILEKVRDFRRKNLRTGERLIKYQRKVLSFF
ncbi:hypothetical protein EGX98_08470 [Fusobacterium necrophorum]|uniref:Uncharacterized protein n=1 Tax=Fusobacterium necrophorum BL TaxID=1441732 RepID=A0AB73BU88_9FUSO|nr:hypothetical protein [Fusobacterium necrophorum]AYZ74058.1 hypothetical protein EGX98_08470 [Fusobacterium necrophorum]AZW10061.1 hypothetical protein EO219_11080 [Fusobacterium necrophorum subsp. necrophorum]KDE61578.1 hypothetical protein FUSO5_11615 [Fusobacterium necrophorum BFTR-1]KDE61664.1 hypothetical protein FUSO3_09800 [Fusobacterium necrophorum BL]KDE70922.1 hypothetical protein FUSO7_10255 [Fusobacterium necrophorum BFTR-2]